VNKYVNAEEGDPIPTLKIDLEPEDQQVRLIREVRERRDAAAAARELDAVRAACRDTRSNVMKAILTAVKAHVTLGEICQVFRDEFGEHTDPAYL
jgi:methylmalonyl-CoA mutase N-terminal domain/subunit